MCSEFDRLAEMKKYVVKVFEECVKSVSPRNIVRNTLRFDSKKLFINDDSSAYSVPGDVYVVGFGKAVLNMALEVENILNGRLKEAVVSVPFGTQRPSSLQNSRVRVMEAARNNMPDRESVENTDRITGTLSRLGRHDLLIVLISGGGSALLCSPNVPLHDKILATNLLSSGGASIKQLNTVRKALSRVKGGRLIGLVQEECAVISLILSDVVGDPLSAIASGPTVPNDDPDCLPIGIVDRFGLRDKMPKTVIDALLRNKSFNGTSARFDRVHNYVIGNNAVALRAGIEYASRDFKAVLVTTSLHGDVALVATFYSDLVAYVCGLYAGATDGKREEQLKITSSSVVGGGGMDVEGLTNSVVEASSEGRGLCILSGGEPTVMIRGSGLGGRNQELALRVALALGAARRRDDGLHRFDVLFFSGGTDGIDGPTDACGAFGYPALEDVALSQGLDPSRYVNNNDSYGFYSSLDCGSSDLLKIGHTGTNVMDVHVLIIKPK
ncbi:glycerate kinase [Acyrthosiphon pisum]|uniref:Glycerate kinase n=1 Tax=Acyrthosiphon pisum TaxID=7029 RepID=A0A8R2A7Q1_ACYPI|nr:glycerate kinase [Acyrthosiphon pisum]|eukprot:XP_001944836.2 PREDICTED: glycerate kinase [Acyrthosiphon pisum]